MDVGFAVGGEEEHPVLLDGGAGGGRIARQFGEGGVGSQGAVDVVGGVGWGRVGGGGVEEGVEGAVEAAEVD